MEIMEAAARIALALVRGDRDVVADALISAADGEGVRSDALALAQLLLSEEGWLGRIGAGGTGTASRTQAVEEMVLKGFYGFNAFARMRLAENAATALRRETLYFERHVEASTGRQSVARMVDAASAEFGPLLGWRAVLDEKTTSECREAHGKNFLAGRRPRIGYPGGVHSSCRCGVSRPLPDAEVLQ